MRKSIAVAALAVPLLAAVAAAENWPHWRGPAATGWSGETGLPARWSEVENIAWRLEMPAVSGSTPIIWGDVIFLNVGQQEEIFLWAVDKTDGEVLWQRRLGDRNRVTRKQNMSTPSPVTDGESVWVLTGTGILKRFDFSGEEKWHVDLQERFGRFGLNHGYASSPLLHEGSVVVQVLHGMKTDDPSYVVSFDGVTGEVEWRVERPTDAVMESPDAYTTPAVLMTEEGPQIVVSGGNYVTGHDPATGEELFRGGGFNPKDSPMYRVVASPVIVDDLMVVPTRVTPLITYRGGGRGDITGSHVAWTLDRGPDVPTPATDGETIYVLRDRGTLSAYDVATGEAIWEEQRVAPGTYSASPLLADGKVYVTNEEGVTTVVAAGPEFLVLAENELEGYTLSSIAVSDGRLYYRNDRFLYAIAEE
ncbi:MAG: PQQ-binding-like beta-propeller repeat protein [Thermoanaerobaculia bacterium]|nr:PQQ-binding-like beta-propeller repeat protein [Thermoanaerobaculia bacterium]